MRAIVVLSALVATVSVAAAGEIYVTRDAQGKPVYTDRPQAIPAERLKMRSASSDPAEVQSRYAEQMKQYSAADEARAEAAASAAETKKGAALSGEDRAKRCADSRQRYEALMTSYRLYEETPGGERRYFDSAEIDAARADAKKVMDEFCGGP